jgi:hypothetical protein
MKIFLRSKWKAVKALVWLGGPGEVLLSLPSWAKTFYNNAQLVGAGGEGQLDRCRGRFT